jgi:dihydroorotase
VIGDKLKPHHFCKPVAKRPEDRETIQRAAVSGNPKFFLGTDSAPHLKGAKECADGCAGVFTAPVATSLLIEFFEEMRKLDKLQDFWSGFGPDFYGIPRNTEMVTYVRDPWTVPPLYGGVVSFRAGERREWRLE